MGRYTLVYKLCMDAQNTSEKMDPSLAKKVNKNLERRPENYDFLSVVAHMLQNPKSIGHLNAISLRNIIEEKVY